MIADPSWVRESEPSPKSLVEAIADEDYRAWRFIHIPKTGGSSVGRYLGAQSGPPGKIKPAHPHTPGWMFDDDILTFAFVRHPLDRLVSICAHVFRGVHRPLSVEVFHSWVKAGMPTEIIRGGKTIASCGYAVDALGLPIGAPQSTWIGATTRLARFSDFDFSLKVLGEFLQDVFGHQLPANPNLIPHENALAREKQDWRDYYQDLDVLDRAMVWAAPDIRCFTVLEAFREDFQCPIRITE